MVCIVYPAFVGLTILHYFGGFVIEAFACELLLIQHFQGVRDLDRELEILVFLMAKHFWHSPLNLMTMC